MKTKVLLVLTVISMISVGGIAQGLNNESCYGFTGYTSFEFRNNREQGRIPNHGNERKFNFPFVPSTGNDSYKFGTQGVTNKMTCTDGITAEQVDVIFEIAKGFPEGTEVSIAFLNNDRVFFYGLKRQNNAIINIENHSSCDYTSAVVIDIKNETGIVILSNVSRFKRKMRNIDTLCINLLASFSSDKQ